MTVLAGVNVTGAAAAVQGASASVLGNVFIAHGRAPAVDVSASGEVLFSDNRCELRANFSTTGGFSSTAVVLNTPVAIINANRVRGGVKSRSACPATKPSWPSATSPRAASTRR